MTVPTFAALQPGYTKLWANLVPNPDHLPTLKKICQALLANKTTYQQASQAVWGDTQFWWYVAVTDQMEGGGGARTYLGNGQSLTRPTTEVPAGRGPFASFVLGAIDALKTVEKVGAPTSIERAAYDWEGFNGWGYLNKPINDPYLASFSNEYTKGKFVADHVFDPNAVSQQPGALTILKVLLNTDQTIQPEGSTTVATPVALPTMTNSGLATVMMELDKITKVLEVVVTYVPMVAPFFPPLAPVVPFLPVIQAALKILDDVEAAGGDPMVVLKSIEAGVPDLMAKFKAAQVHPTVVAATAAAQAAPA